jgi:hypothetical protein
LDTYDGLLKTTDNDALGGTYKLITDGLGNSSGVYLGTGGNVGIGQSSPTTYKLDVNGTFRAVSTAYFESGINAAASTPQATFIIQATQTRFSVFPQMTRLQ